VPGSNSCQNRLLWCLLLLLLLRAGMPLLLKLGRRGCEEPAAAQQEDNAHEVLGCSAAPAGATTVTMLVGSLPSMQANCCSRGYTLVSRQAAAQHALLSVAHVPRLPQTLLPKEL
jgi:hypothetical protein